MPLSITSLSGDNLSAYPNKDWVEQVRNLAAQCTDQVPFLLVPVRLEARFVTVTETAPVTRPPFRVTDPVIRPIPTGDLLGPIVGRVTIPTRTQQVNQLRVRIFPDDISVRSHEPALTRAERDAGIVHWREVAAGGGDEPAARAAWRALCVLFGPQRAAWVARLTRPSVPIAAAQDVAAVLERLRSLNDLLDRLVAEPSRLETRLGDLIRTATTAVPHQQSLPASGLARAREAGAAAGHKIDALATLVTAGTVAVDRRGWDQVAQAQDDLRRSLAELPARDADPVPGEAVIDDASLKEAAWTQPARAAALPHRFVVITVANGQVSHVVAGNEVPADLVLGIDPQAQNAAAQAPHVDAQGNLVVGESLRWLVEYDVAHQVGMAINVPITAAEAAAGFDRVYVLGLAAGVDPDATARGVADLLDAHHYSAGGLSVLPIGTPTNNTDAGTSGHRNREDPERSFEIEMAPPSATGTEPTDGDRLARGLGVDEEVFARLAHADGQDISDALAANSALWPATGGYAVEELLGRVIGGHSRDYLRRFATRYVLGRGGLPSLRIGAQPYGVLTTTAFDRFESTIDPADERGRFERLLRDVLLTMRADWATQASRVAHAYSTEPTDPAQRVLAVLGLDAVGRGHANRIAVNTAAPGSALHVGVPANAETTVVRQGAFAVVQRFADVFAAARGLPPGPPISGGAMRPGYDTVLAELDHSRPYGMRYIERLRFDVPDTLDVDTPSWATTSTIGTANLASMVDALLSTGLDDLARIHMPLWHDQPLLFALLRQALLVQARDTALRILEVEDIVDETARARLGGAGQYLISGLGPRRRPLTRWSYLFNRLSGVAGLGAATNPSDLLTHLRAGGDVSMSTYLAKQGDNPHATSFTGARAIEHQKLIDVMRSHARAVRALGALPKARADRATIEHLDTCSHRLDAWLLGLATSRLEYLRNSRPTGVHRGAFGWLEDLRPVAAPVIATDVPPLLNPTGDRPVYEPTGGGGFIHAPSIDHAAVAAVLRSGYLTQSRAGTDASVNISSRRVRSALALLDGITAGNDLGALLGYQFERDLHDAADRSGVILDALIAPLRARFPSVVGVEAEAGTPSSDAQLGQRHVVDGLSLLMAVRTAVRVEPGARLAPVLLAAGSPGYPYGVVDAAGGSLLPPTSQSDRLIPVLVALDRLADTLDALSDLVLTEGTYQIIRGNHPRAAAVLSALGEGRTPVWPEVVDTPVTGTLVSHRVLWHLRPGAPRPDGWTAPSVRADAEPAVNHWLGSLIGPPGETRVQVVTDDDGRSHVADVSLAALEIQPIDLFAMLHTGFDAALAELSVRVLDTLRPLDVRENEPAPALRLELARHPDWPDHIRSLADTAALVEIAAQLVGRARAATPADYLLAETASPARPSPAPDRAELASRVSAAIGALGSLGVGLIGLLSDGADSDPSLLAGDVPSYVESKADVYRGGAAPGAHLAQLDALWRRRQGFHEALLGALGFGISGVRLPTRWESRDQVGTAWLEAAETALVEVAERLRQARAALGPGDPGAASLDGLLAAARAVFTDTTPILPRFALGDATEIKEGLAEPPVADPTLAALGWLGGVASVRENIAALTTVTSLADAFGRATPSAVPVQLPRRRGEAWVGESVPAGSRLSLVLVDPSLVATDGSPNVALVIDNWDELVPSPSLTTGVAFQFDQPASAPPQCVLLAVPPRLQGGWRWEDLVQTLHETLELAKLRAVEPEHLQDDLYGDLLPALIDEPVYEPEPKRVGDKNW